MRVQRLNAVGQKFDLSLCWPVQGKQLTFKESMIHDVIETHVQEVSLVPDIETWNDSPPLVFHTASPTMSLQQIQAQLSQNFNM